MARLDDQLARLAALPLAGLPAEWERVYKTPAPKLSVDLLRMGLAYRLQERALGALPKRVLKSLTAGSTVPSVKPGTRLIREWNGRTIDVLADGNCYIFDGERYASLSAIARAVTGTAWSDPRFFGLQS